MRKKAGILPVWKDNERNEWLYFLGQPTPIISKHNKWSILKGTMEKGETHEDTAIREFTEEALCADILNGGPMHTSSPPFNLSPNFIHNLELKDVGTYRTKHSAVKIYYIIDPRNKETIKNSRYRSNEFEYKGNYYPEMQDWGYFTYRNAMKKIYDNQKDILSKLNDMLNSPSFFISYEDYIKRIRKKNV